MKIIQLQADNFKRLVAIDIKPDGNMVVITGKNGAGKSSVLDSIMAGLCGKKYSLKKPVRDGEDRATVNIDMGDYKVMRTFTKDGGGTLKVTNAEGWVMPSPQALLDKIVGKIAFDPMSFSKQEAKEQRKLLMELLGLDFTDLDAKVDSIKMSRTECNTRKTTYQFEADQITFTSGLPGEEVNITELGKKLSEAVKVNAERDNLIRRRKPLEEMRNSVQADIEKLVEELTNYSKQLMEIGIIPDEVNDNSIALEIQAIDETNSKIRFNKMKKDLQKFVQDQKDVYSRLGKQMKEIEEAKAKRLAAVKMPVEGLVVTDEGVEFEGIPLAQVNNAKKLEIGIALSMAMNPDLRVLRMDGNGCDKNTLEAISKVVGDKGYQCWVEKTTDNGDVGIVIESGAVKKIKE